MLVVLIIATLVIYFALPDEPASPQTSRVKSKYNISGGQVWQLVGQDYVYHSPAGLLHTILDRGERKLIGLGSDGTYLHHPQLGWIRVSSLVCDDVQFDEANRIIILCHNNTRYKL